MHACVATLWLSRRGGVFPLLRPCGRSTVIPPQKKQAGPVAAVQVSSRVHGHHVKLRGLSRCFGLLFLGLFNHGVLLPRLEGHGQISALLTTPKKKKKKSGPAGKKKNKQNCSESGCTIWHRVSRSGYIKSSQDQKYEEEVLLITIERESACSGMSSAFASRNRRGCSSCQEGR